MKKLISLALIAMLSAFFASAQDLDEILKNHYEVTGAEKLSKAENLMMEGKSFQMGMETTFKNITTRSGKYYLEVPIQGENMIQVFDGESGWMIAPWTGSSKPMDLPDVQKNALKRQSDIDGMLYNYEEKGYETSLAGREDLKGRQVYVIEQKDGEGNVFTHYMDADKYVILRMSLKTTMDDSEIEVTSDLGDYRQVDGVLLPFSVESYVDGQFQSKVTVEEVNFNVEVDSSLFEKPR